MKKLLTPKFIGMGLTVVGVITTVIQKQLDDRKLEEMIDKKVQQRLDEREKQ